MEMFTALADDLEQKTGGLDLGFGWNVSEALRLDRDEMLDAFRELEPLYRRLAPPRELPMAEVADSWRGRMGHALPCSSRAAPTHHARRAARRRATRGAAGPPRKCRSTSPASNYPRPSNSLQIGPARCAAPILS